MHWIYYIIGFISFPVVAVLFLLLLNRKSKVEPFVITDANKLQELIGLLFNKGEHGEVLYILDQGSEFIIRITKMVRKTKANTLKAEIRASDKNAEGYPVAKAVLTTEGIDFEEKLTPKLKRPSKMFIKNDEGGIFTVSLMARAVSKIMSAMNETSDLYILASEKDPFFWKKIKT